MLRPSTAPTVARHGHRFLVCPDAELLRRQAAELAAGLGGASGAQVARKVFWGDEEPFPPAYWGELTTQNLFSTPTVLLLRRAEALKAEVWDRIGEGLKNAASTVLPVFCLEGAWKEGKPAVPHFLPRRALWSAAEQRKWVWQSPGLTEASLPKFLDAWAAERGLTLDPAARQALAAALPRDGLAAGLELDKIELAAGAATAGGNVITAELAALVAPHGDMEFFDFMKALSESTRSTQAAREVWARVLDDHLRPSGDKILFQLLGYVAWQARQLWMLAEGEGAKVRMRPSDKPVMTRLAQRLGRAGIARIIELTLDANLGVIGGLRRPDDALESYVADLAALMGGPGALPQSAAGRRA
ncbi:MAG: DNA polymerase III subunit delta [Proteobacteria bacterium]|nr:DNA polymerase III subunit delta [Pseudomonadota bacterium]MBU1595344.1 DNA polymerase III subunit delta [Pseudomonadota bacterium]